MNNVIKIAILPILLMPLFGSNANNISYNNIYITNSEKIKANTHLKDKFKLTNIGLYKENDKIIIDLNKTEQFFKNIIIQLKKDIIQLRNKTNDLNISSFGIKIDNKERIKIDLNKTKIFLKKFSNIMEQITKDFNNSN